MTLQECRDFEENDIDFFFFRHIAKKIITDYDDDPEQEETTGLRLTCSNRRPLGSIGYTQPFGKQPLSFSLLTLESCRGSPAGITVESFMLICAYTRCNCAG